VSPRGRPDGVDARRNIGAIISNEIILFEMHRFLERNFKNRTACSVLDLGAGTKPYAPLYEGYFGSCVSVDVPFSPHDVSNVDVMASAEALPFDDGSFDCVICTEVLEHCPNPRQTIAEISRVLRRGGQVFLTTPFLRPLHEMPHDYFRYTPSGLRELATSAGLSVRSIRPRGEYFAVALAILQMPVGKCWYLLAKYTHLPLDRVVNPLVYITIVLPQQVYVRAWMRMRRRPGRLQKLYNKLSYYTLGYVTELEK
jgi:ubiquinone/menaquinone biosynthesis C-methylase UbiE